MSMKRGFVTEWRIAPQQTLRQGISIHGRLPTDRCLPSTLTTDRVEAAVLLLLCEVTAARFSVTLSRGLMMCSTVVDSVLNCC